MQNYLSINAGNGQKLVSTDLADDDPEAVLSPNCFFVDFEKSMINAISAVFPSARINNCLFHCLQAWRRKLAQRGFKPKMEKKRTRLLTQNFENILTF